MERNNLNSFPGHITLYENFKANKEETVFYYSER